jgi:uncharacterized protein YdhG (YjbR/CyaY superfamily)
VPKYGPSKGKAEVDAYLASAPKPCREKLAAIRALVLSLAPDAEETIAYGIPTFKLGRNLVHYAGYARHVGLYPGSEAIARHAAELRGLETSKGAIRFPIEGDLPLGLIERIVAERIAEERARLAERVPSVARRKA